MLNYLQRSPFSFQQEEKNKENFYFQQSLSAVKEQDNAGKNNCFLPECNQNLNYELEYKRLFLVNVALVSQPDWEDKQENSKSSKLKKKRIRRAAENIDRHYKCPLHICGKSYGSEGSLHQHLKLKHPQLHDEYMQNLIIQQTEKERMLKRS